MQLTAMAWAGYVEIEEKKNRFSVLLHFNVNSLLQIWVHAATEKVFIWFM